jgi:hypothetical protein
MENRRSEAPPLKLEMRTYITTILVIMPVLSLFIAFNELRSELGKANRYFLVVGPLLDARKDERICPVHALPLQEDTVPIVYGLIIPPKSEMNARRDRFPYANSEYLGGCVARDPRRARVLFCPECRKAEKEWKLNVNRL